MIFINKKLLFKNKIISQTKSSKFYLLLFVLYTNVYIGQVNLVLNPSFEQLDSCPDSYYQIGRCKFWGDINNINPCQTTLFHSCCINPSACGMPSADIGAAYTYQWPRTGNAYCLTTVFTPLPANPLTNFRYYTIGTLNSVLINGKSYCGKVYINLCNTSPYKINQFGMYYDDGSVIGTHTACNTILGVSPQIANNPTFIMSDTLGWMKIEGVFTANGTENRITIGNFKSDNLTTGIPTGFFTTLETAVYNIDDISLIPFDTKAFAGNDTTICISDTLSLGRKQEVGLECLWYTPSNSLPFSSNSNITFKPSQTGQYTFIQKMDNCQITFDTVTVTVVEDCNTILSIPNVFTPNGDNINDTFNFKLLSATDVNFNIYNRWGNIIKSSTININNFVSWDGYTTSGESCNAGIYFYTLEYKDAKNNIEKKNGYISLIK